MSSKMFICPRCGEFFYSDSKFPICRKCEFEEIINISEETDKEYLSLPNVKAMNDYEEHLREQYVYTNPAFSKKYYNLRIEKDKEIEAEQQRQWHDHPQCPKCFSPNTYRTTQNFSLGKSIVGSLLGGTSGAIIGGQSGQGKEICVCRNCGHKWRG